MPTHVPIDRQNSLTFSIYLIFFFGRFEWYGIHVHVFANSTFTFEELILKVAVERGRFIW